MKTYMSFTDHQRAQREYLRMASNAKLRPDDTAELDYGRMLAMARAMPDVSCAILLVLWWHASFQARLRNAEAGSPLIARITVEQLAVATGHPDETVTAWLETLKKRGLIELLRHRSDSIPEYQIRALTMRARPAAKPGSLGAYSRGS